MTASTMHQHHRPSPFVAAAAAVAAIAACSVTASVLLDSNGAMEPSPTSVHSDTPGVPNFHVTTGGGRVMLDP